MSDPVTNAEIEDVLSSIRRLVSEDSRSTVRQRVEEQQEVPDRLVLTPSLRVANDEPVEDATEPESLADERNAASDDPQEFDGEQPDDGADDSLTGDWVESESVSDEVEEAEAEDDGSGGSDEAPWNDPDATLYAAAAGYDSGEERHAATDDGIYDDGEIEVADRQAESAEGDPADLDEGHVEALDDWSDPVSQDFTEPPAESPDTSEPASDNSRETPDLAEAVEVLGAAMDGTAPEDWEPQGEETAGSAAGPTGTMTWQDDAEPEPGGDNGVEVEIVGAEPQEPSERFDEDEDVDLLDEGDTILDEASLRELVTDIVREELQGALGERITRNVRKLVRREINRALSVQDLE